MLAFHGFGQQSTDLLPLGAAIADEYTMYSFDLFYHGESYWNDGSQPIDKAFWKDFILEFTATNDIHNFSVCGFSLGGKFALATLEAVPERIEKIILMAPDGIKTNFWYSLATYPIFLKRYFQSMIVRPNRFLKLVRFLEKAGLVEKSMARIASSQMATIKKRRRVYYAWVVFKELSFDIKKICRLINKFDIEVYLFLGKYDKIITRRGMRTLLKHLKRYKLEILTCGHHGVITRTADFFRAQPSGKRL